jgi:CheY-specific phosphatase CheX
VTEAVLQQTLASSVEDVLEKMFFFSPPEDPDAGSGSPEPEIAARVSFTGEPPGDLTLRVTRDAARSIAADFLAAEIYELQEDQVIGVLCELANMICGSVLSRVESATTFHLSAPCLVPAEEMAQGVMSDAALHRVEMFGGALTVAMTMDKAARVKAAG